jgi:hypothetical protein
MILLAVDDIGYTVTLDRCGVSGRRDGPACRFGQVPTEPKRRVVAPEAEESYRRDPAIRSILT